MFNVSAPLKHVNSPKFSIHERKKNLHHHSLTNGFQINIYLA